jgi:Xaa-Pro dipeptidase
MPGGFFSMSIHESRREKIYQWMNREEVALVMVEDFEGRRDPAVRWLTGQPGDALLFLAADKRSMLVPWDINMAQLYASADMLVPYAEFERQPIKTLRAAADYFKIPRGARIEIPPVTPYPQFLNYVEALSDFDVLCRNKGLGAELEELRAVKDEEELGIYRAVSEITNEVIDLLEEAVAGEKIGSETEAALFIEAEARRRGCEGMGFETLAAGPGRSFGIHCFPAYTAAPFAGPGLSILDFGLKYRGYTSDVTLTFARPPLSRAQEKQLTLIERAYNLALSMVGAGTAAREVARAVDELFAKSRRSMPHGLGHGIGLEAHEGPPIRSRADNGWILQPGMVFTLEPGLYDPVQGGCRLENDIMITGGGVTVLTKARIIRL